MKKLPNIISSVKGDITTFRVEGTVIPGMKETALPKALSRVEEYAF